MYCLGYDLGSSSVKVCLLDAASGRGVAHACYPDREMTIDAPKLGWAEQAPETWWECAKHATERLREGTDSAIAIAMGEIGAIGISYQMHGLVLVDRNGRVVRPAIIWCDSRAVDEGARAFEALGARRCLDALLNAPGNFTASKLAWVRENEPAHFERAHTMMLPGDYFAWRLTGRAATTLSGLSEGILWDFSKHETAAFLLEHFAIPTSLVPDVVPTFGEHGRLTEAAAEELGLKAGTPVTYRAGDQPNNALSLGVLEPGEIAATAGTSGVVYGISDTVRADRRSRVNSFAHVNHSTEATRLGILLCINGTWSAYRWLRERLETDYDMMNEQASEVPIGCDGLCFFPFGNGVERMLENRALGASMTHLDFNTHGDAYLARGVQEGIAFAFQYGMDVLRDLGMRPAVIRAGLQNMFLSPVFREILTSTTGVSLKLYRTDGAEGAARGAAFGVGHYASLSEALTGLRRDAVFEPNLERASRYREAYRAWADELTEGMSS